jgi:cysteine desulfurase/selenocysteine lyase
MVAPGRRRGRPRRLNLLATSLPWKPGDNVVICLEVITHVGVYSIEAHVRALSTKLASGLLELGLPVAGGPPGPHLGHIVSVGQSGGGHHDTVDDPAMDELCAHLTGSGVRPSIRRGLLRMSVGVYNDDTDVDRVIELARDWVERHV